MGKRYNLSGRKARYTQEEMERLFPKAEPVRYALCQGYVSRRIPPAELPAEPYIGRYGKGYVVYNPSLSSKLYCYIIYYIVEE